MAELCVKIHKLIVTISKFGLKFKCSSSVPRQKIYQHFDNRLQGFLITCSDVRVLREFPRDVSWLSGQEIPHILYPVVAVNSESMQDNAQVSKKLNDSLSLD